jgi:hypothetical protein
MLNPLTVVTNGVDSEAEPELGDAVPLVQVTVIGTLAPLSGTKSLLTVRVVLRSVLTMVQVPADRLALQVPLESYPAGIGVSLATQFGLPTGPLTVNAAGVASLAEALEGLAVPLAQLRVTVTLAPLLGTKSFWTVNGCWMSVFTIVQPPAVMVAVQLPELLYPGGIGDSVAVQLAPGEKPDTVVVNGVDSLAEPDAGDGVPLVQETLTLTLAPLLGWKSLLTVNTPEFWTLIMVQLWLPPTEMDTLAQAAWLSV